MQASQTFKNNIIFPILEKEGGREVIRLCFMWIKPNDVK